MSILYASTAKLHEVKGHGTILRGDCAYFGATKALRCLEIIGERMEMCNILEMQTSWLDSARQSRHTTQPEIMLLYSLAFTILGLDFCGELFLRGSLFGSRAVHDHH